MTPLEMPPAAHALATEVVRPAAVLPETSARQVLVELAYDDVRATGCWATSPGVWARYDRPWDGAGTPGNALLLGVLQVGYGTPTRYAITVFAGGVTAAGREHGWSVEALCDDALAYGGYTLATCPRVDLAPHRRVPALV